MVFQPLDGLAGAPGAPKKPVHIGPHHGASMIQREEWIKADFLELALSGHASSLSFHAHMLSLWEHFS